MKFLKSISVFLWVITVCTYVGSQPLIRTATIIDLKGKVEVKTADSAKWVTAEKGMVLKEKDAIRTGNSGWALLGLDRGETATVEVKNGSRLMLDELKLDDKNMSKKTLLDLAIGKILIKVEKLRKKESKFEVKTPTSIIGVRGTKFAVEVENLE